jgi:two-component system phosphate regulon sensor histidine kinase PhoR
VRREIAGRLSGVLSSAAVRLAAYSGSLGGHADTQRVALESVLESLKDSVIAVDARMRVTLMNAAAVKLFKAYDWRGKTLAEVTRVNSLVEFLSKEDLQDDATFEFTMRRGPHNRHIQAHVSLQSHGGKVVVFRDVTTVRRLERMRRDFVANVSHELRTPISVVSANAETLLDGAISDERFATKLLEAVHRNAERLTLIVNDLLDLSRLEAGSYSLHSGRVNVEAVARRVVESLAEKAEQRESKVTIDCAPDLAVMSDEAALYQVLVNYLENAIKYAPAGSHIEIRAARRKRKRKVRIAVCDDGPGIEPKLRNRVFERFFRIDPGRSREMGGTGLGLSIVKHLAEAMGGRVGVEANEPQGSIFWIDLPSA